jgi:hypothetical protein
VTEFVRNVRVLNPATPAFAGQGAYDLVGLTAVKAELQLTDGSKDTDLLRWITQSSSEAAKFCNRVFPVETVQEQIFPPRDFFPPISIGGADPLQLKRSPVAGQACVAGIAAPLAPALSVSPGGLLAAGRFYVRATYVTAMGETAVSAESNIVVPANDLLTVASPVPDTQGLATGWNVYVGTKPGQETLQNASPLPLGTAWTEPLIGIIASPQVLAPLPGFVSVIENQIPLTEGVDFLVDTDVGQLTRLDVNGWPKRWPPLPIVVFYPAGYSMTDPDMSDAQDAVTRMVKGRYFAQTRDPALRQENIEGVFSATYWFGAGPGASPGVGNLPPDIQGILEKYRSPVVG